MNTKQLDSVNKVKHTYQDIMCVCNTCTGTQGGYKYSFNYSIQPTMEPISYKLKGYKQNAGLSFNDIGIDIQSTALSEVSAYMGTIASGLSGGGDAPPIVTSITASPWNDFNNWRYDNKIFQKTKRYEYKDEVYSPYSSLPGVCMSVQISSNIYIVSVNYTIIDWD